MNVVEDWYNGHSYARDNVKKLRVREVVVVASGSRNVAGDRASRDRSGPCFRHLHIMFGTHLHSFSLLHTRLHPVCTGPTLCSLRLCDLRWISNDEHCCYWIILKVYSLVFPGYIASNYWHLCSG